ncbi:MULTISPECIES: hypothetical protein [Streptomyces]|uniref:hypothetical protein n=1 Tax=Streptomyces TaxID=1883 RepID=UPI0004C9F112|nr:MULTISPECIES: hypothetical protein [unclassified Streptomyces]KOV78392.1 hypothetical protein ADL02_24840 [Streptomyces sp. NRRL WC-3723]
MVDYAPRQIAEPVGKTQRDHVLRNTVGLWFHHWGGGPYPRETDEQPTQEQEGRFQASAVRALAQGHSMPVLFSAAAEAGLARAENIDAHLKAVQ